MFFVPQPCVSFAVCSGCPIGARYSADFHVAEAEATGNVTVLTETVARRIDVDETGRVTAVHANGLDGTEISIAAKDYVIAAHAIETAVVAATRADTTTPHYY